MLNYKTLYTAIGVRKIDHILTPRVLKTSEFEYPKDAIFVKFTISEFNSNVTTQDSTLGAVDKAVVMTTVAYSKYFQPLGKYKQKSVSLNKVVGEHRKSEKKFKFLAKEKTKVSMPITTLAIINTSPLTHLHKYSSDPMNDYYKWHNGFGTAVATLTDRVSGTRHKFINIDLPNNVPTLEQTRKTIGAMTKVKQSFVESYKGFNYIEVMNFMTTSNQMHSVLHNNIPKTEYKNIDLIFTYDDKVVVVNLHILASILKTNDLESKLPSYTEDTVLKLLHVFFKKLMVMPGSSFKDISEGSKIAVANLLDNLIGDELRVENKKDDGDEDVLASDVIDAISEQVAVDETTSVEDAIMVDTDTVVDTVMTTTTPTGTAISSDLIDKTKLHTELSYLREQKLITKAKYDKLTNILETQNETPSLYVDGSTVGELLVIEDKDVLVTTGDKRLRTSAVVKDSKLAIDTRKALDSKYIEASLKKDITRAMYGLQNVSMVVESHDVALVEDILGSTEIHHVKLQTPTGTESFKLHLPVIEKNGTYRSKGNRYVMRKQRTDIPVRKISQTAVNLSSFYGKLGVTKATYKKDDMGTWFLKKIVGMDQETDALTALVTVPASNMDTITPVAYGQISRYVKGFRFKDMLFSFDYNSRQQLVGDFDISTVEKDGSVVVGAKAGDPIIMTHDGIVSVTTGKEVTQLGTIPAVLGFDETTAPIEFVNISIFKKIIPIAVPLAYMLGLPTLMKRLGVQYREVPAGKRPTLSANEYSVKFKDVTLVLTRDYGIGDLVLSGLRSIRKTLTRVTSTALSNKGAFSAVYAGMELPLLYVNEITLIEDMFIDHHTADILRTMKIPTAITEVFIKAVEMLSDDNYTDPNDINGMTIKGYVRMSGMVYSELVSAVRVKNNGSHFGKTKLKVNPFAVTTMMGEDSTVVLVDDLNPIAQLKQHEDVTYLGKYGRSEITMTEKTRKMHVSELGVISEGVKDNGGVGISAYLSANPKLKNTLGMVDTYDFKEDGWGSTLSTSAILAPFGTNDDINRLKFAGIQNGHVIPIDKPTVPYIRTGADSLLGERVDENYVISAKHDGVVSSIRGKKLTVTYTDDELQKPKKANYNLKEWTTKEENGACYTHKLITNLRKGDKFTKGTTLAYTPSFFAPDIFDPTTVTYKCGTSLVVALMEDENTFEDSSTISTNASAKLTTTLTVAVSKQVQASDPIYKMVKVGDSVTPESILFTIGLAGQESESDTLDDRTLSILQGIKNNNPKAGYTGKVTKIVIIYHSEYSGMSRTLRQHTKTSDTHMLEDEGYTGQVGDGYSVRGKQLLPDEVEVKIYMDVKIPMGVVDKGIFGNQLKYTISEVFDYKLETLDGTEIDATFSTRSLAARKVDSARRIGVLGMFMKKLTEKGVEDYFG